MTPHDHQGARRDILVSVVVPTLNEEKLLDATLASFSVDVRQRYAAELIVSDGGSQDATISIAARHADHIVEERSGKRQNIAQGRNRGAEAARGDVIVFINADTVPHDVERFMAVIHAFAQRTGPYARASALATPVNFAPADRRPADRLFHGFYNAYVRLLNALRIGAGRGECQIVRTAVFRSVNGYRENLAAGEDFDLFARIGLRARVRFAPELLVLESPRRFRKFGYFRVLFWWTINALSVMVRGRSSSDEWEPVR
ncbi:MAG: glycosyltransferase [Candidatus Kapabacteria bacterium]|nr:glycosyltransferase [Candidatus Kapabacteria bacterium]